MPQRSWSAKRERQYEHIKGGLKQRGDSEELAEEIAARTVRQGTSAPGGVPEQEPQLHQGHFFGPPGWSAFPPWCGRPDPRPALSRSQAQGHHGPFQDDEGPARARGRALTTPSKAAPNAHGLGLAKPGLSTSGAASRRSCNAGFVDGPVRRVEPDQVCMTIQSDGYANATWDGTRLPRTRSQV